MTNLNTYLISVPSKLQYPISRDFDITAVSTYVLSITMFRDFAENGVNNLFRVGSLHNRPNDSYTIRSICKHRVMAIACVYTSNG
mmetsp:Transcript_1243/g.1590  ORF Transcript_1243/g.1590 Transcript_1243/m.1590 type:complete len:85 (-) Transcript_1243:18-272(-)